jgi:hypothetical protein
MRTPSVDLALHIFALGLGPLTSGQSLLPQRFDFTSLTMHTRQRTPFFAQVGLRSVWGCALVFCSRAISAAVSGNCAQSRCNQTGWSVRKHTVLLWPLLSTVGYFALSRHWLSCPHCSGLKLGCARSTTARLEYVGY